MYKLSKNTIFLVSLKAVIRRGNKILIVKSMFDNRWEMPGGFIDENESLTTALKREIKEEVGLSSKVGKPLETTAFWHKPKFKLNNKAYDARIIVIAYKATVSSDKIKLSEEHSDYGWVTIKELSKYPISRGSKFIVNHLLKN